jgi:lipopolysaccharide/colanic/teichoic acid biosynthesis glycosyltransferase
LRPQLKSARYIVHAGLALCALVVVAPLLAVAAAGIVLSSPGPILYRARRIARDRRRIEPDGRPPPDVPERRREGGYRGREFTVYKLRTMHMHASGVTNPITGRNDARVFPFGALLRATKIDELPQLLNVIRGDMALVGPRPEAPEVVRRHYRSEDLETLQVLPGLTSPGSLYYYIHCEALLGDVDVTQFYVERLLPLKLGIDRVYISNPTLLYDLRVILKTIGVIVGRLLGRHRFPEPPEITKLRMPHR